MALNTIEAANIIRVIARLQERIEKIEGNLQGVPLSTVRIADLAVTDAKINSLAVDKLTAGTLGINEYILVHDNIEDEDIILIGWQSGGFG